MKHSFSLIIILLLLSGKSFGQRIFNQYNFNEGGYYICLLEGPIGKDRGIPSCPVSDKIAIDTTSFFYTSDTVVLNRLKKELVLYRRPSKNGVDWELQCGYPFWFCLFKAGNLLFRLPANLECGYMSTSLGQMVFNSRTLKQYKKNFKPLILKYTCFNTADERIQFVNYIQKDSSYVSYKVMDDWPKSYLLETIQLR